MAEGRTWTVCGGKRNMEYNNFNSVVKRLQNLAKEGRVFVQISYHLITDSYTIYTDYVKAPRFIKTPGYQRSEYIIQSKQKFVVMTMGRMNYKSFYHKMEA